jgi:hypothetical protein
MHSLIIAISGIESNAELAKKLVKQHKKGRWCCYYRAKMMPLPAELSQKIALRMFGRVRFEDYFATTPLMPPETRAAALARILGSISPRGQAIYFGCQTGANLSLYSCRPWKL